jgi:hypothetical protein
MGQPLEQVDLGHRLGNVGFLHTLELDALDSDHLAGRELEGSEDGSELAFTDALADGLRKEGKKKRTSAI